MFYFSEFYKSKMYNDAYESWQYLIQKAPCAYSDIYTSASKLFDSLISQEQGSARREILIDSLLYAYDVRSTYFPDKFTPGSSLGMKARLLYHYREHQYEQAFDWIVQAVEMEKENTIPVVWQTYFDLAILKSNSSKNNSFIDKAYELAHKYIPISIQNANKSYENSKEKLKTLQEKYDNGEINQSYYQWQSKTITDEITHFSKLISGYNKMLSDSEKLRR